MTERTEMTEDERNAMLKDPEKFSAYQKAATLRLRGMLENPTERRRIDLAASIFANSITANASSRLKDDPADAARVGRIATDALELAGLFLVMAAVQ